MGVGKNVVCGVDAEIKAISEMYNVSDVPFFSRCRPYHSVTDCYTWSSCHWREYLVFILFSDGVENGRYVALCMLNKVR